MDKMLSPELIAIAPAYVASALLLVIALVIRRSKLPAVMSARAYFPVIFFGGLTVFAASYGLYYAYLSLRELLAASATGWRYFLAAEFALLFAYRFLGWTLICLVIKRGTLKYDQVRLKHGVAGRILFMAATGAAAFAYIMAKLLFGMPWWFTHLGHAVIAALMFCAFTYPWSRDHRTVPNKKRQAGPPPLPVLPPLPPPL